MNIIEAVRSNKPFRRPGWVDFIQFNESRGQFEWVPSGNPIAPDLRPEWFTYEDWEVEPDRPRYSIAECIGALSLVRNASHDMTISMIDSILFYLQNRNNLTTQDWEVEEKTVTITKSQLESACRNAVGSAYLSLDSIELDSLVEELQKELGL